MIHEFTSFLYVRNADDTVHRIFFQIYFSIHFFRNIMLVNCRFLLLGWTLTLRLCFSYIKTCTHSTFMNVQKANCELSEYRVHKQQIYLYECVIGSEDTHTCRWFCIEQERRSNNHHHYLSACTQHTLYNNSRTSLQVLFNIYATLLQDFFLLFWVNNEQQHQ